MSYLDRSLHKQPEQDINKLTPEEKEKITFDWAVKQIQGLKSWYQDELKRSRKTHLEKIDNLTKETVRITTAEYKPPEPSAKKDVGEVITVAKTIASTRVSADVPPTEIHVRLHKLAYAVYDCFKKEVERRRGMGGIFGKNQFSNVQEFLDAMAKLHSQAKVEDAYPRWLITMMECLVAVEAVQIRKSTRDLLGEQKQDPLLEETAKNASYTGPFATLPPYIDARLVEFRRLAMERTHAPEFDSPPHSP